MLLPTFLALLPFSVAFWECPKNPVLPDNGGFNIFPAGNDTFYGPNAHCYLQINIPDGLYAMLSITAAPSTGDVLVAQNTYLNIPITGSVLSLVAVGPNPLKILIDSTSISGGSLQVGWILQKVQFQNQARISITSGKQPTLLRTFDVGSSSKTLIPPAGQALSISTASFGRLGADSFLTGAMLYKGDKVDNGYLYCLYNRINETSPLQVNETVTLVFLGTPIDAGVFSVSAWSDVAGFLKLQLQYSNNFVNTPFPIDATGGMAGMMLYQQNGLYDTLSNYVFSPTKYNLSLYAGGVPISSTNLLSTYGSLSNADNAVPQAIPGSLKTFVMLSDSVRIQIQPNTNGTFVARENMTGFFMSKNYPFPSETQPGSQLFTSVLPLNLTTTLGTIDSSTTITVSTTGIYGPGSCTFTQTSKLPCRIYGTNFLFTSESSSLSSTGGLVRYTFGDHKGPEKDKSSPSLEISLFLLGVSLLFQI